MARTKKNEEVNKIIAEENKVDEINEAADVQNGDVVGGTAEEVVADPISTESDTVTICSNYPRDIKFNVPDNHNRMRPIVIRGNSGNIRGKESGIIPIGAYGITTGVPREAWEYIQKNYKDAPYIIKGLMFATTANKARAAAKERTALRHGYEPIDPNKATNSKPMK